MAEAAISSSIPSDQDARMGDFSPEELSETRASSTSSKTRQHSQMHAYMMSSSSQNVSSEDPNVKYEILEELGKGSYGSVYKGRDRSTSELVAIKVISLTEGEEGFEELRGEIEMLQQCNHQNVVRYMGSYCRNDNLWIVMEYCGGGSVADLMAATDEALPEPIIAYIAREALKGLAYLHSIFKVHRDIKGGNILLTDSGEVKLGDFGVAAQLTRTMSKRNTFIGTPHWMAPEVIQESRYDSKIDIWAFGITSIEMAEGLPPRSNVHPMRVLFMISREPSPTLSDPEKWSLLFHDFVAKCLSKEPRHRPTADSLLQHKFIEKCKGSGIILKKRIDAAKSAKKKVLSQPKEGLPPMEEEEPWDGGGTVKINMEMISSPAGTPGRPSEDDLAIPSSGTIKLKRPILPSNAQDPLSKQLSSAVSDLAVAHASSAFTSAAAISAANLAAAKVALAVPGNSSPAGKGDRKGKERPKVSIPKRVDAPEAATSPAVSHAQLPPHPPGRSTKLPAVSTSNREEDRPVLEIRTAVGSSDVSQRSGTPTGKSHQEKLLNLFAAGSTIPIPFLRANEVSPLALIGNFLEDGQLARDSALEAVSDLCSSSGDGALRKNRRSIGNGGGPSSHSSLALPAGVHSRLLSSHTLFNLSRALAYHKQCLEEMPLQGSAQVGQEVASIQNLSDALRTILRL